MNELQALLDAEKASHNSTRNKYDELQNSFKSISSDLDQERKSHDKTKVDLQSRDNQIAHLKQRVEDLISSHK